MAGVRDGKEQRFYVNGAKVGSLPASRPLRFSDHWPNFYLGSMCDGVQMREVRVSNVVRYTGEQFTTEPRFAPDKYTLALYRLDEGAGEELKDSSGNGHHGKRIATSHWVRAAAGGSSE